MTARSAGRDVRHLVGLRTPAARWGGLPLFVFTFGLCAFSVQDYQEIRSTVWIALAILTVGVGCLILVGGDPQPMWTTGVILLSGPAAVAVTLFGMEYPFPISLARWPIMGAALLYAFACPLGRIWLGWLGMTLVVCVVCAWSWIRGGDPWYGVVTGYMDYTPLLIASVFALTIRPSSRMIFALRDRSSAEAEREAATRAVLEERDRQLRRLDELARPLLRRVGSGEVLSDEERAACGLLEAQLRDALRARVLVDDRVNAAVRHARIAGAEIVLLDDSGGGYSGEPLREALLPHLMTARGGTVTARLLPPGRAAAMTVLVTGGVDDDTERYEYDVAGALVGPGDRSAG